MTVMVPADSLPGVVAKLEAVNPSAASTLLELALYEALCDEIDRVRPAFERDVDEWVGKRLDRAMEVAKSSMTPERFQQLEQQGRIKRGPMGRFVDMLSAATGGKGREGEGGLRGEGAQFWDRASQGKYERMGMLGSALRTIPTAETQMAGRALSIAAALGPEAQKILEPGVRRTAYRYRGTEKRPSRELTAQTSLLARAAGGKQLSPEETQAVAALLAEGNQAFAPRNQGGVGGGALHKISPEAAALRQARSAGSPDQRRLTAVSEFLTAQLREQIPSMNDAKLSLEAGKMPPSIGVLVDAQGNVVSEAMGFNGDHYLPFDLKNLKSLRGGQYVRTRTTGGLTDEDIYTALMTGARKVTVVSNSGVFSLDFDQDLRGGRRYSDKSRQMVSRYQRLIAAVESEQVEQTPISRDRIKEIKAESTRGVTDPTLAAQRFETAMEREKQLARFNDLDEEQIEIEAAQMADYEWRQGQSGNKPTSSNQTRARTKADLVAQHRQKLMDEQYRVLRLDGDGYNAAQRALKTEFPYFVRSTSYEPMRDYLINRGLVDRDEQIAPRPGKDIGRHRPRATEATQARQTGWAEHGPQQSPLQQRSARNQATRDAERTAQQGGTPQRPEELNGPPTAGGSGSTPPAGPNAPVTPGAPVALADAIKSPSARINLEVMRAMTKPLQAAAVVVGPTPLMDWTPEDAMGAGSLGYAKWALGKFGVSQKLVDHLVKNASVEEIETLKQAMDDIYAEAQHDPRYADEAAFDEAKAVLDVVSAVKEPYADVSLSPDGDPVRLEPTGVKPPPVLPLSAEPRAIAQAMAELQASPETAMAADLAIEFQQRLAEPDGAEGIAEQIAPMAEHYNRMRQWDGNVANAAAHGFTPQQATEHAQIHAEGENNPVYQELRNHQVAWQLAHMAHVLSRVTGLTVDLSAAPEGGAPAPFDPAQGPAQPRQGFSMRSPSLRRVSSPSRVVLHKADSPVARALQQHLARR